MELQVAQQQVEEVLSEINKLRAQQEEEADKAAADVRQAQQQVEALQQQMTLLSTQLSEVTQLSASQASELQLNAEKLISLQHQHDEVVLQTQDLESQLVSLQQLAESQTAELAQSLKTAEEAQQQQQLALSQLEAELEQATGTVLTPGSNIDVHSIHEENDVLCKQIQDLQSQLSSHRQEPMRAGPDPQISLALNIVPSEDSNHTQDSAQVQALETQVSELSSTNSELQQQASSAGSRLQQLQTQLEQLSSSNSDLAHSHSEAQQRVATLEQQLGDMTASYSELKYGSPSVEKRVRSLQRQVSELSESDTKAQEQITSLQEQLEVWPGLLQCTQPNGHPTCLTRQALCCHACTSIARQDALLSSSSLLSLLSCKWRKECATRAYASCSIHKALSSAECT